MAELQFCDVNLRALDELHADVLALTLFRDQRPLSGLTGLVDWRMCGALSRWARSGFVTGTWGERVLVPSQGRMTFPRLLLLGLGERERFRADRAQAAAVAALEVTRGLQGATLATGMFGLRELPSPFKRTGVELVQVLSDATVIERVTVVAPDEEVKVLREYGEFF